MAVEGHIRLCKRGFKKFFSDEGSCLHVKTGSLLSFQVKTNIETAKELVIAVSFAFKAADCATECLKNAKCEGFMSQSNNRYYF